MELDARIPDGPLPDKWERHRGRLKLVSPANKRKYRVLVVGTGLAGASAAASLAELGYNVAVSACMTVRAARTASRRKAASTRRRNYTNDSDNVYRLFYDTIKGGDYRSREANVFRLAQVSSSIMTSAPRRVCRSHVTTAAC